MQHYFKQFASWRTEVKMSFGPAMTAEDGPQLSLDAHDWINRELKEMQKDGHRLILWTYRHGKRLDEAVEFCKKKQH